MSREKRGDALAKVNWDQVRLEYVTGNISQRKLAEKCGVAADVLMRRARREQWKSQRDEYRCKVSAKGQQKIEDEQSEMLAAFTVKIYAALDDLTDAISAALKKKSDGISGADALAYARALLTIKNTLAIDNPLDAEEKHWRIEKLRRESERDTQQQNQTFIVRMEDGIEEWAK